MGEQGTGHYGNDRERARFALKSPTDLQVWDRSRVERSRRQPFMTRDSNPKRSLLFVEELARETSYIMSSRGRPAARDIVALILPLCASFARLYAKQ